MDVLEKELLRLQGASSLSQSIEDVDKILEQLCAARNAIVEDPNATPITLTKLQNPVKQGFEKVNDALKKVYSAQSKYGKSLDKNFPTKSLPTGYDALLQTSLINRAIAMHLLREGEFHVASTFLEEVNKSPSRATSTTPTAQNHDSELDLADVNSQTLQSKFANMYEILNQLQLKNLLPAIEWARGNSDELEARGSNLEFELSKLQFVWLFQGPQLNGLPDDENNGLSGALKYARENFTRFQLRFLREIQQLAAAMAFGSNLPDSPYSRTFQTQSAWDEVAVSFTREFCSLLGLAAESPLYIAATAGAIGLPTLLKVASIMKEKRTEWTTQDELPVEIPLPKSMFFHNIFVCPVSKEQTTESNPPMMLPCGHVVARESLGRLSKGQRCKCPYCPVESWPKDARQIYL